MTEKRYILENESDFERARAAMVNGLNQFDTEIAIGLIYDKFLAPIPKIFADKFKWMAECAEIASVLLRLLPDSNEPDFYKTHNESVPAWSGQTKVTTYDAPDGNPLTSQALGMTVEYRDNPAPATNDTEPARGTLSAAAIESANARKEAIRRAFQPMILPIWGDDD